MPKVTQLVSDCDGIQIQVYWVKSISSLLLCYIAKGLEVEGKQLQEEGRGNPILEKFIQFSALCFLQEI